MVMIRGRVVYDAKTDITAFYTEVAIRFSVLIIMYAISIIFAISPLGEKLLRFIENVRKLETKKEKEYLLPIFREVCEKLKIAGYKIRKIEICVIDAMYINAVALGRKTIAVTKGAIDTLSEDELKGLIAHELGHIYYSHTTAVLISNIGNGIFMIPIFLFRIGINAIETLHSKYNRRGGIIELLIFLIKTIFNTVVFVFVTLGQLILSINSRANEYTADKFAYKIGYGAELTEALYLLHDMIISDKMSLVNKLRRSHPVIAKRIGRLEKIMEEK